jgi:hypothetical protein
MPHYYSYKINISCESVSVYVVLVITLKVRMVVMFTTVDV